MSIKVSQAKPIFLELEVDGVSRKFEILKPSAFAQSQIEDTAQALAAEINAGRGIVKNTLALLEMVIIGYDAELFGSLDLDSLAEVARTVRDLRNPPEMGESEKKS